jgi:23S rRNA pseudouridine1911/1915/1917 synthase
MAGVCVTVFGMTPKLTILYEDNHLLVVDKPAPLPTMGASEGEDSLVNMAKDYLRVKYNKPGNVFLGVVSRLDSFVTGVVVLARTSKAASRLSEQFRSRSVEKTYWAIVADPLPGLAATLEHQVYKNESRHRMQAADMTIAAPADAKMARLSYRTLGTNGERTLIEVKLDTGRKHQIRVQLEAIGCPIVGDRKYGSEVTFKQGVALHSQQLAIDHPTSKERMTFQAPPPKWWRISRFSSSQ